MRWPRWPWGRRRQRPKPPARTPSDIDLTGLARAVAGRVEKRARVTEAGAVSSLLGGFALLSPPDSEARWRDWDLDSESLDKLPSSDLLELLCDLSPDVSRALWDFLRFTNAGWEAKAFRPGSEEVDEPSQAVLDGFLEGTLRANYGSADVLIGQLFFSAFLRGGFWAEIVLDERGRAPVDLVAADPRWLHWRKRPDPARGWAWEPFQYQNGQPVSMERETVKYVPVDPFPGKPYGRPMASPALWTALFMLGLLHDLRRVVAQQGWPRIDVSIAAETLAKWMPAEARGDARAAKRWLDSVVAEVKTAYADLQPDDAYVHTDTVTVNRPVGTVDSSSLGAVDGLIKGLERQIVRALKSTALLFGVDATSSEAQANRQWECHAAGVKSIQHLCESLLEHLLGIALRVQGRQAVVRFRFAELRASELLRDAQVEQMAITNAGDAYDRGWLSQDEACEKATGKPVADVPEPRAKAGAPAGGGADPMNDNPDPGALRWRRGVRYNPNHDPKTGEFSGGGGSGGGASADIGAGAEEIPTLSQKAQIAKQNAKRTDAKIQRYSEEHNEPVLASELRTAGGKGVRHLPDNEPADVLVKVGGNDTPDGIELKTMVDNANGKITMSKDAISKKRAWVAENQRDIHTVLFDDHAVYNAKGEGKHGDVADRVIYYKRGFGSFRRSAMYRVKDYEELMTLLESTSDTLPKKAKPPPRYTAFRAAQPAARCSV